MIFIIIELSHSDYTTGITQSQLPFFALQYGGFSLELIKAQGRHSGDIHRVTQSPRPNMGLRQRKISLGFAGLLILAMFYLRLNEALTSARTEI